MLAALEKLVSTLKELFTPLVGSLKDPARLRGFLRSLGWVVDADTAVLSASPLSALGAAMEATVTALAAAEAAVRSGKADPKTLTEAIDAAVKLFESIRGLSHGKPGGPGTLADPALYVDLAEHLGGYVVTRFLETRHPALFASARLLGLVVEDAAAANPGDPRYAANYRVPHHRYLLNLSGLTGLIDDPLALLRSAWVRDEHIDERVITVLRDLLYALGVRARFPPLRAAFLAQYGGAFGVVADDPAADEPEGYNPRADDREFVAPTRELDVPFFTGLTADGEAFVDVGLAVFPTQDGALVATNYGEAKAEFTAPLGRGWSLQLGWALDASGLLQLVLTPNGLRFARELPTATLTAALEGKPERPWVFLGKPEKPVLWLAGLTLGGGLRVTDDGPELLLQLGTPDQGKSGGFGFRLDTSGADGFLAELFAGVQLTAEFGIAVEWSSRSGLNLQMSGGFSLVWVMERKLGPLMLHVARLQLNAHESALRIETSVTFGAEIGPFKATVDEIGMRLDVGSAKSGSSVPVQTKLGFKPPTGVGFAIDAETVKGGGFLVARLRRGAVRGGARAGDAVVRADGAGDLEHQDPGRAEGVVAVLRADGDVQPGDPARVRVRVDGGGRGVRGQPAARRAGDAGPRCAAGTSTACCSRATWSRRRRGSSPRSSRCSRSPRARSCSGR
jgi:hypothetical protein